MRPNLAAPDAFTKVTRMTNHIGLWDADLAWYSSLNATYCICLYGLEYGLRNRSFKSTLPDH